MFDFDALDEHDEVPGAVECISPPELGGDTGEGGDNGLEGPQVHADEYQAEHVQQEIRSAGVTQDRCRMLDEPTFQNDLLVSQAAEDRDQQNDSETLTVSEGQDVDTGHPLPALQNLDAPKEGSDSHVGEVTGAMIQQDPTTSIGDAVQDDSSSDMAPRSPLELGGDTGEGGDNGLEGPQVHADEYQAEHVQQEICSAGVTQDRCRMLDEPTFQNDLLVSQAAEDRDQQNDSETLTVSEGQDVDTGHPLPALQNLEAPKEGSNSHVGEVTGAMIQQDPTTSIGDAVQDDSSSDMDDTRRQISVNAEGDSREEVRSEVVLVESENEDVSSSMLHSMDAAIGQCETATGCMESDNSQASVEQLTSEVTGIYQTREIDSSEALAEGPEYQDSKLPLSDLSSKGEPVPSFAPVLQQSTEGTNAETGPVPVQPPNALENAMQAPQPSMDDQGGTHIDRANLISQGTNRREIDSSEALAEGPEYQDSKLPLSDLSSQGEPVPSFAPVLQQSTEGTNAETGPVLVQTPNSLENAMQAPQPSMDDQGGMHINRANLISQGTNKLIENGYMRRHSPPAAFRNSRWAGNNGVRSASRGAAVPTESLHWRVKRPDATVGDIGISSDAPSSFSAQGAAGWWATHPGRQLSPGRWETAWWAEEQTYGGSWQQTLWGWHSDKPRQRLRSGSRPRSRRPRSRGVGRSPSRDPSSAFPSQSRSSKVPLPSQSDSCGPPSRQPPMSLKELLNATHAGTVCALDTARGIAFVRNRRIHDLTGWDVRFRLHLPPQRVVLPDGRETEDTGESRSSIGDVVCFEVDLDSEGRPWVRTYGSSTSETAWQSAPVAGCQSETRSLQGVFSSGRPLTVETLLKEEHVGVVSEYLEDLGYGFIKNAEIHRLCGRDVRFQGWQLLGLRIGDTVAFRVKLSNDGLPRVAGPVSAPGKALPQGPHAEKGGACASDAAPAVRVAGQGEHKSEINGGWLEGVVIQLSKEQGYGLVACDELRFSGYAMAEALLARRFISSLSEGDSVAFRTEAAGHGNGHIRRGMRPRAVEVRRLPGTSESFVPRQAMPFYQNRAPQRARWHDVEDAAAQEFHSKGIFRGVASGAEVASRSAAGEIWWQ